jgi:hypothetical protein
MWLNDLWQVISFFGRGILRDQAEPNEWDVLPKQIQELGPGFFEHLRYMLINGTAKWFGQDALVTKIERDGLREEQEIVLLIKEEQTTGVLREHWSYAPMDESVEEEEEEEKFWVKMKKLLKWAGLEGVDEKLLLV